MVTKKQEFKRTDRECYFCHETDYDLLDAHRIIPGNEGGKYTRYNTVICCSLCHRKIHAGRIKIIGKHFTTGGNFIFHYTEDGEEKWG